MGKSKHRKARARRPRPTGVPSVKELEECDEFAVAEMEFTNSLLTHVIEKLQSRNVEDKECAAGAIAKMAYRTEFVTTFVENAVAKIVAPLLLDASLSVRHAVAGCLRNLCVCGGHDVSKALVDQDVMTPLCALLKQYNSPWAPIKCTDEKIDSKKEIFFEACSLLWSLCESSNVAITIFNNNDLISILLPCLNIEVFGLDVPVAVAHCLHTVSEENPDAIQQLSQPLVIELLESLMSLEPIEPAHVLLRTLAAGIYLNINNGKIDNCKPSAANIILGTIVEVLDIPIEPLVVKFAKENFGLQYERGNRQRDMKIIEEKVNAVRVAKNTLDGVIPAKQVALEMLTNFCFCDDEIDWDDMGSSDASDEMDIEDISTPITISHNIPCDVHSLIINQKLLTKVIGQVYFPDEESLQTLHSDRCGRSFLKRIPAVSTRALLCANNILQGLDINELGGAKELYKLWLDFAKLVTRRINLHEKELLEAATSCVRAVLEKLAEGNCKEYFTTLKENEVWLLIDIFRQSEDPGVKVNIVRSIATLACIAGSITSEEVPKIIYMVGSFLLDVCTKSTELWVVAEALDAIFDVFAEDHLDGIAREIGLVEKLNHFAPCLKRKIKLQRRSLGEHFIIVMTAKTNLLRFIKYKTEQSKNSVTVK